MEKLIQRWIQEGMPEDVSVNVKKEEGSGLFQITAGLSFVTELSLDEYVLRYSDDRRDSVITPMITGRLRGELSHVVAQWLREHSPYEVRGL